MNDADIIGRILEIYALQEEIAVTVELAQNAVAENERVAQAQDDYDKRCNALVERYDRLKAQYDEVSTACLRRVQCRRRRLSEND